MTARDMLRLTIDGRSVDVPPGCTVAAAAARAGLSSLRRSPMGAPRSVCCGMGVCQECALLIDGRRRLACQTLCRDGMQVRTAGAAT